MKKTFLVLTTVGFCSVSSLVFASDKALATAWSGVSDSIARVAKSTTVQGIAASLTQSPLSAASVLAGRSERDGWTRILAKRGSAAQQAEGGACPFCPDPPCE